MTNKKTAKHPSRTETANAVVKSVTTKKSTDENKKIIYFNRI
jgi:hypothetical protein